ncbi:MAG: PorV/PorQ family protein [Ignavibacterium sp.]|nr:PorV/PorQ family protein [Ignavibacterium sp.]MCX7612151.1 PorV/PorQ family protein [Ignavibacterium sp.]MDW8374774.1 PorV/PorQ family protein [Ignavibacteriales bacterium]
MKKIILFILFCLIINSALSSFAQERKKLAQTGMKFLSVSLDPRSSGLSDAVTSITNSSTAMLYNPSTMAKMDRFVDYSFGTTKWIADINYIYGTAAINFMDGQYGVLGVSLVAVDYGEFNGTIVANNDDGYIDVGTYKPTAIALGLGYAKALSEKFFVGGNVKYVRQSMGTAVVGFNQLGDGIVKEYKLDVLAFDFGILYKTGFKSLNFGMNIRNFSKELKYVQESFQLPLNFKIGLSMDAFDLIEIDKNMHSLLVSVDASHPRDYPEQLSFGLEYTFLNSISFRGGYTFPTDEQEFSAGVGFKQAFSDLKFAVDYSYTPFGIFNKVHRVSINIGY